MNRILNILHHEKFPAPKVLSPIFKFNSTHAGFYELIDGIVEDAHQPIIREALAKYLADFSLITEKHDFFQAKVERQLRPEFNLRKPRNYKVTQRLVKAGLVIHQKFFYNNGIYYLSNKGARHTELPSPKSISPGTYDYQLTIIDVHMKLMQLFPDAIWVSERYIKRDKFMEGISKNGHVADAMMFFPDQKQVAIEVEGEYRLEQILLGYGSHFDINQVWYFCNNNQPFNKISKLAADRKYIKVYSLREFLNGMEMTYKLKP